VFGWLLRIFTGDVVGQLTNAYLKAKDSQVEGDKTRAHVLETQLANALEAQKLAQQVRLATAGFWEMRVLTFLIALPFVVHVLLVGADTCFKLGLKVNAFPPPFDSWEGAILLSFFGLGVASKGVNAVAAAFIARRS
jgi:hypothetical protein